MDNSSIPLIYFFPAEACPQMNLLVFTHSPAFPQRVLFALVKDARPEPLRIPRAVWVLYLTKGHYGLMCNSCLPIYHLYRWSLPKGFMRSYTFNSVQSRAAAEAHLIWDHVIKTGVPEDYTWVLNLVPNVPASKTQVARRHPNLRRNLHFSPALFSNPVVLNRRSLGKQHQYQNHWGTC